MYFVCCVTKCVLILRKASMYALQAPGPDMAMPDVDDEDQLSFKFMFQVFRCKGPTVIIVAAALVLRLRAFSYAGGSDISVLKLF